MSLLAASNICESRTQMDAIKNEKKTHALYNSTATTTTVKKKKKILLALMCFLINNVNNL